MAMTARYTVLEGEVVSELRSGVEHDYVPDPLGSTVALLNSTQTQTDTFTYWPYGEVNTRTGTTATPFQYVGTLGYYQDSASKTYVRARHLDTAKGRWLTQDPVGFYGCDWNLYRYVTNRPTVRIDPSGTFPCALACLPCASCLIDLALVCSDCRGDWHCWIDCISGTISELPWGVRWLCEKSCIVCIECFVHLPPIPPELPIPQPLPGIPGGGLGMSSTHPRPGGGRLRVPRPGPRLGPGQRKPGKPKPVNLPLWLRLAMAMDNPCGRALSDCVQDALTSPQNADLADVLNDVRDCMIAKGLSAVYDKIRDRFK